MDKAWLLAALLVAPACFFEGALERGVLQCAAHTDCPGEYACAPTHLCVPTATRCVSRTGDTASFANDGQSCDDGICVQGACQAARCGDGVVSGAEECDDGNRDATDSCTSQCGLASCGDGVLRADVEACDDGNRTGGDGCNAACDKLEVCGDNIVDVGEDCDDGNTNPFDGCASCQRDALSFELLFAPTGDVAVDGSELEDVALGSDGSVYVVNSREHRVYRLTPSGQLTVFAGSDGGFAGDGGPARAAKLLLPRAVAVSPLGEVFIADTGNCRIRRVDLDGNIRTVAGSGCGEVAAVPGPAAATTIAPIELAVDGLSRVYFAEQRRFLRRLDDDEIVVVADNIGDEDDAIFVVAVDLLDPEAGVYVSTSKQFDVGPGLSADFGRQESKIIHLAATGPEVLPLTLVGAVFDVAVVAGVLKYADSSAGSYNYASGATVVCASERTFRALGCGPLADECVVLDGSTLGSVNFSCVDGETYQPRLDLASLSVPGLAETAASVLWVDEDVIYILKQNFVYKIKNGVSDLVYFLQTAGAFTAQHGDEYFVSDPLLNRICLLERSEVPWSLAQCWPAPANMLGFAVDDGHLYSWGDDGVYRSLRDDTSGIWVGVGDLVPTHAVVPAGAGDLWVLREQGVFLLTADGGATLFLPSASLSIAAYGEGLLVHTDTDDPAAVRAYDTSGALRLEIFADPREPYAGDGGSVAQARFGDILEVRSDGESIYIRDERRLSGIGVGATAASCVRRIDAAGRVTAIAGPIDPVGAGRLPRAGVPGAVAAHVFGQQVLVASANARVFGLDLSQNAIEVVAGYPRALRPAGTDARYQPLPPLTGASLFEGKLLLAAGEAGAIPLTQDAASGWQLGGFPHFAGVSVDDVAAIPSSNRILIVDSHAHCVYQTTLPGAALTIVAGRCGAVGNSGDGGPATDALLNGPTRVVAARDGGFYVGDSGNRRVRHVAADGTVSTVLGDGTDSNAGQGVPARAFPIASIGQMVVDVYGNLVVAAGDTVRVVADVDGDGMATGEDAVVTVFDAAPLALECLSAVVPLPSGLLVLDACTGAGVMIEGSAP